MSMLYDEWFGAFVLAALVLALIAVIWSLRFRSWIFPVGFLVGALFALIEASGINAVYVPGPLKIPLGFASLIGSWLAVLFLIFGLGRLVGHVWRHLFRHQKPAPFNLVRSKKYPAMQPVEAAPRPVSHYQVNDPFPGYEVESPVQAEAPRAPAKRPQTVTEQDDMRARLRERMFGKEAAAPAQVDEPPPVSPQPHSRGTIKRSQTYEI